MTQLEQQMQAELIITQGLCNYLAEYLTLKGVPSTSDEGLDTLVPKVLTISTGGTVEHDDTLNKNSNPLFLHIDATTTKETLVEDDKVAIYDSVTGKVVLTDKSNVEGINKLLPLIYAGL